jgi:hypothetical protein
MDNSTIDKLIKIVHKQTKEIVELKKVIEKGIWGPFAGESLVERDVRIQKDQLIESQKLEIERLNKIIKDLESDIDKLFLW